MEKIQDAIPWTERTVNPATCWVVAWDECENRAVGYMPLYEEHWKAAAMAARMNKMQEFWNRKDGISLFSGDPIVWQWFDLDDPGADLFKPENSRLAVFGVTLYADSEDPWRMLVRAKNDVLANRIAACYAMQFHGYRARSYSVRLCYNSGGGLTTNGIEWFGGPGKAPREAPV